MTEKNYQLDLIFQVGLAFDQFDVLWGVENSADRLKRNDIGGDIHNQNPAEELNRFLEEDKGKHTNIRLSIADN